MAFIQQAQSAFAEVIHPWLDIFDQRFVLSYLGAVGFLFFFVGYYKLVRQRRSFRLRALVRFMFKKSVWLHKSALLDCKLYLVNMILGAFILGSFTATSQFWSGITERVLGTVVGRPAETLTSNWGIVALITLVLLLAMDFGYWLGHLSMHKSEYLWEFHKTHHSAQVMTPATEFRQHPVELILVPNVMGFTTGIAYALVTHWWGTGTIALASGGYGIILCLHILTFHHLRHSHINMPFTGVFGKLLHSPGHHQIHHSDNPLHFDRNMGYILSIWDWMAGTLHAPRPGERVTIGIGREGADHTTVVNVFWLPFRNSWAIVRRRAARRAVAVKGPARELA